MTEKKHINFFVNVRRLAVNSARWLWGRFKKYWRGGWWHKTVTSLFVIFWLVIGAMYGIAQWYIHSEAGKPLTLGVSFIPDYAEYLGVNWHKNLTALINQMHVKNFRLTSYWNDIEPTKDSYDFSQLDWEFKAINSEHGKVTLAIGLRQPRWPECHAPTWVNTSKPESQWQPELEAFMKNVVNRYKNNPALKSYQLENEFSNRTFGACNNYDRRRLVSEFNLVKSLDKRHPIIISRGTSKPSIPLAKPRADLIGQSIYRHIWSPVLGRYYRSPDPAWYFAFLAGLSKIVTGQNSIIHELQAEPWPPNGKGIPDVSLAVQNKTMDAAQMKDNFDFAKATGMKTIYLWGGEYWYYRWKIEHDKSMWNTAQQIFAHPKRM